MVVQAPVRVEYVNAAMLTTLADCFLCSGSRVGNRSGRGREICGMRQEKAW